MKKVWSKSLAIALSATMAVGGVGATAYALTASETNKPAAVQAEQTANTDTEEAAFSKDESVYVLANADGTVKKIIVSDWIKNTLGAASISDTSSLTNLENVNGDEAYTMNGDNLCVWDAAGNDIYYQGNIDKELPVNLQVSYQLDGNSISASDLLGKSGKVTIRFDYQNNQSQTVSIDGKDETIYVPFAMLTGMMLDSENFTNVEVSNGKLVNDGSHTFVVGIAFPGMQENLALNSEDLTIPDYVEITADVKDFSMANTVTIATNDIFNHFDTNALDKYDDLTASLTELTTAMNQLMDGSSQLYDGLCTLLDKSAVLVKGVNDLADGAQKLKEGATALSLGAAKLDNGAAQLKDGAGKLALGADALKKGTVSLKAGAIKLDNGAAQLKDGAGKLNAGATELAAGLNELKGNNAALNGGAKQVFETLLATANTQLAAAGLEVPTLTISNYSTELTNVIANLDEKTVYAAAKKQVTAGVEAKRDYIEEQVTEQVKAQVTAQVKAQVEKQVGVSYDQAPANVKAQMDAAIEANVKTQMASAEVKALIKQNTDAQVQKAIDDTMNSAEIKTKLATAAAGKKSVAELKASLDSYNQFYQGLTAYTAGVATAADGAAALKAGTTDLKNGASDLKNGTNDLKNGASELASGASDLASGANDLKNGATDLKTGTNDLKNGAATLSTGAAALYDGVLQLQDGVPALIDGITQLRDGSMTLKDGLCQFDEEGIQKLVDAVDGDISGLVTRFQATCDVSKAYVNFSGISDDMDGKVNFIYRTDSIE